MTPEIETRKINIINWVSSLQEEEILRRIEEIQRNSKDWWETISETDPLFFTHIQGISEYCIYGFIKTLCDLQCPSVSFDQPS